VTESTRLQNISIDIATNPVQNPTSCEGVWIRAWQQTSVQHEALITLGSKETSDAFGLVFQPEWQLPNFRFVDFAPAAIAHFPADVLESYVCFGLIADIRCAPHQRQLCADSELCKVARTAQNYRSRWPLTLQRSFPEADINTLPQHY
jgi:hypothetical protein